MFIKQNHQLESPGGSAREPQMTSPAPRAPKLRIDVLKSLRLHPLTATLVALLTLCLGLAVLLRNAGTYSAKAIVYVSPEFQKTLTEDRQQFAYESYIQEQIHTVTRYEVLAAAIRKLPGGVWQQPGESEQSAVQRLQSALSVSRNGLTYQMFIELSGARPDHLAEIVNAVTDTYIDKTRGDEFYGRDQRLSTLQEERQRVQSDLDGKQSELASLTQSLGVAVVSSNATDSYDDQVTKLRADLSAAHTQRIQAEAQLSSLLNGGQSSGLNAAADEIIASDPGLTATKTQLSQKRAVLLDQLAGLKPNHPVRQATEAELAQIDAALQKMQTDLRSKAAGRLEDKLRAEVRRTTTVESKLLSDLQYYTRQATSAAPKFQRIGELKTEIEHLQARYAAVDERTRNIELESNSPGSVHVFSAAMTPLGAEPSKTKKLGLLLLPFSLLMGVLAVVAMDFFDPRIYSATDIEDALGYPPMGMLLDDREVTIRLFDECMLRLAAGVDHATRTAGVRTFVVSAVTGGAGTTSIVENLGSTLAKLGRKTLTIDASGATGPVAYVTIGLNRGARRTEAGSEDTPAAKEVRTAAVVQQPLTTKLTPLSSFMDQAFKDLTNEYDIVLIDAAPLLISAETEYLSRFADVTVLVAEAGRTRKADLMRAARVLDRLRVTGIAAIVNKVSLLRAERSLKQDLRDFEARSSASEPRWNPRPEPADSYGHPAAEEQEAAGYAASGDYR